MISEDRIKQLERDNRRTKVFLLLVLIGVFTMGAVSRQIPNATTLDANTITLRRSDGAVVGQLKVEDRDEFYDITLRDSKGVVRLSIVGLDGVNVPPLSLVHIHDPEGRERINVFATEESVGIGLASADVAKAFSYSNASSLRASLRVDKQVGSLKFFDKDSKLVVSLPANR